jgi:hypothetical protein
MPSSPYTATNQALQLQYGQSHQPLSEIGTILTAPELKVGDFQGFQSCYLHVILLVSMLLSLEGAYGYELKGKGDP